MMYGYTMADQADNDVFSEIAKFVEDSLHYEKDGEVLYDVDGSKYQEFSSGDDYIRIESSTSINYVARYLISHCP